MRHAASPPANPVARAVGWLFTVTLLRVKFGLFLMAALAAYIAIGSGVAEVREYFEMNEMQFFNAWPMRVLALLLVLNVVFVTFDRIPFTLPRLGVWMVHAGIVILIIGMTNYFVLKVEGLAIVHGDGRGASVFYDGHQRALYVKSGRRDMDPIPLELPRFKAYDGTIDVGPLTPVRRVYDEERRVGVETPLGGTEEPLEVYVDGYWPYAEVEQVVDRVPGAEGARTALELTHAPHEGHSEAEGERPPRWLFAGEPGRDTVQLQDRVVRHIHRPDLAPADLLEAAGEIHRFRVQTPTETKEINLVPGAKETIGGYTIAFDRFQPNWRTIDGRTVDAAILHIDRGEGHVGHFNRMLLDGDPLQTDFLPSDDPDGPPIGERQDAPVDDGLVINYKFADTLQLTARGVPVRHTVLTGDEAGEAHVLSVSHDRPPLLSHVSDDFQIGGERVRRYDDVVFTERVHVVPSAERDEDVGRAGDKQVVRVRLQKGDWSEQAIVPFHLWPMSGYPWNGPVVDVPGIDEPVRLQLGNMRRFLPRRLELEEFEAIPYQGAEAGAGVAMRDFASTLNMIDPRTGEQETATVRLNDPVFITEDGPLWYDQSWLLYQASWDPERQSFTVLGVGNRPGIKTMSAGFALMVAGLLWAFYVKPVIIRRRKEAALQKHREQQASPGVAVA